MIDKEIISRIMEMKMRYQNYLSVLSELSVKYKTDMVDRVQKLESLTDSTVSKIQKQPESAFTLLEAYKLKINTALIDLRDYIENNHMEDELPDDFEIQIIRL